MNDDARDLLAQAAPPGARAVNIFATLVRHPGLFRRWLPFGGKLLRGKLATRDRELAILRTAWLCESPYEWAQHVLIAEAAGVTPAEVEAIAAGPTTRHGARRTPSCCGRPTSCTTTPSSPTPPGRRWPGATTTASSSSWSCSSGTTT